MVSRDHFRYTGRSIAESCLVYWHYSMDSACILNGPRSTQRLKDDLAAREKLGRVPAFMGGKPSVTEMAIPTSKSLDFRILQTQKNNARTTFLGEIVCPEEKGNRDKDPTRMGTGAVYHTPGQIYAKNQRTFH